MPVNKELTLGLPTTTETTTDTNQAGSDYFEQSWQEPTASNVMGQETSYGSYDPREAAAEAQQE